MASPGRDRQDPDPRIAALEARVAELERQVGSLRAIIMAPRTNRVEDVIERLRGRRVTEQEILAELARWEELVDPAGTMEREERFERIFRMAIDPDKRREFLANGNIRTVQTRAVGVVEEYVGEVELSQHL